jgi:hypothetical protein
MAPRAVLLLLAMMAALSPAISRAETLTNEAVVSLVHAGLGSATIVAKIQASANTFDTSTAQLVALKGQGVPDSVIAAMLSASASAGVQSNAIGASNSADPNAPHASGIYLLVDSPDAPRMARIDPTTGNQSKTSGVLAYAFTYGIVPVKMKTVIPNPSARVKSPNGRPTFYFYFNQTQTELSGNQYVGPLLRGAVTSPNEFSLVRFEVNNGQREVVLGQFNITGMKSGVMDKARVNFTYSDVAPGVFKVTPDDDLPPGQYGFVYSSGGAGYGALTGGRIFDFAVGP